MTTSNLDRLFEEVKTLTPDEQSSLRDMIDELVSTKAPDTTSDELERKLLDNGIISRIPPRIRDTGFYENRKPIEVKGKPVSEIIIEERR